MHIPFIYADVKIIYSFSFSICDFLLGLGLRPLRIGRVAAGSVTRCSTRLLGLRRSFDARRVHGVADLFAVVHVLFLHDALLPARWLLLLRGC
jgi:hypothetical protein